MNHLRGSLWRRWDLHIHTKDTAKNDQFSSPTFEDFCITFFKEALDKKIAVIGITDYFNIENYKRVKEFQENIPSFHNQSADRSLIFSEQDKEEIKKILLLPNVELRMMPATNSSRLVNIHCLFNPEFVTSIENDFFGSIEYVAGSGNRYKMNRQGMIGLGKSLDPNLGDDAAFIKGVHSFVVSHGDLQKLYDENIRFKENVLIAVSNSGTDGASAFQQHYDLFENDAESQLDAVRKSIYHISHAIFTSNGEDRKYFLGEKIDNEETVIRKCGSIKPCLHGSDAHTEAKLFNPDNNMFCWIQADTTFEGLKQVIWDPKERVKIQERSPDTKPVRIIIDYVLYKDTDGNEKVVYLNKDLDSIIGVRGSGKSTLLKNIAYKVDPTQYMERDKVGRLYHLDDFKVVWGDGQEDAGTPDSPKNVFYLPQNYLSSLAYDDGDKARERDEFLTKLLKKHTRFANAIQTYGEFVSNNKVIIEGLIESLLQAETALHEATEQIKKQGAKQEIEKEIEGKNEEIKKYNGTGDQKITDEEIASYSSAQQILIESEKFIVSLDQDKLILSQLSQQGTNILVSNQEFTRLSPARQELIRTELVKQSKENLDIIIVGEVAKINLEIKRLQDLVIEQKKITDALDIKIKANKALEGLTKELSGLQQIIQKIGELSTREALMNTQKEEALAGLENAYNDFEIQQQIIFSSVHFDDMFSFLTINTVAVYNTEDLKRFVERNINTRDSDPILRQDSDLARLISDSPVQLSGEGVKKVITGLLDQKIKIKVEAGDIGQVISQLLKNRYEMDYLNSVKTKGEGTHFKDMTGGQKAIALLELIFSFDDEKYPILIDQPEDDLDVGGVATDLVNFIKSQKNERQIIIVSHNGSLVVCADTEEVVVSSSQKINHNKYNFSYKTGAIENPEIRDQIIQVLEGGREALKQRARKLNFKHEI